MLEKLSESQRRQVDDLLTELKRLLHYERFSEDYLALTAEPNAPIERIEDILDHGEASGLWDWELSSPEP